MENSEGEWMTGQGLPMLDPLNFTWEKLLEAKENASRGKGLNRSDGRKQGKGLDERRKASCTELK